MRQKGVFAHFLSPEAEAAFLINGAGKYFFACFFLYRNRFAADHAFVYKRGAVGHFAVYGNAFAGFYEDDIVDLDIGNRYFRRQAVSEYRYSQRLQSHKLLNGARGVALGPCFEEFAQ